MSDSLTQRNRVRAWQRRQPSGGPAESASGTAREGAPDVSPEAAPDITPADSSERFYMKGRRSDRADRGAAEGASGITPKARTFLDKHIVGSSKPPIPDRLGAAVPAEEQMPVVAASSAAAAARARQAGATGQIEPAAGNAPTIGGRGTLDPMMSPAMADDDPRLPSDDDERESPPAQPAPAAAPQRSRGPNFQLNVQWWKTARAVTLKKTGLTEALERFEDAQQAFYTLQSSDEFDFSGQCLNAFKRAVRELRGVDKARLKAISLCNDTIHGWTKSALQNDKNVREEEQRLIQRATTLLTRPLETFRTNMDALKRDYETINVILDEAATSKASGSSSDGDEAALAPLEKQFIDAYQAATISFQKAGADLFRLPNLADVPMGLSGLIAQVRGAIEEWRELNPTSPTSGSPSRLAQLEPTAGLMERAEKIFGHAPGAPAEPASSRLPDTRTGMPVRATPEASDQDPRLPTDDEEDDVPGQPAPTEPAPQGGGPSFRLSVEWWKEWRAVTLKKTGLTEALEKFEGARMAFDSQAGTGLGSGLRYIQAYTSARDALEAVDAARRNAISLCSDTIHGWTKKALSNDRSIVRERQRLLAQATGTLTRQLDITEEILDRLSNDNDAVESILARAATAKAAGSSSAGTPIAELEQSFLDAYHTLVASSAAGAAEIAKLPPPREIPPELATIATSVTRAHSEFADLNADPVYDVPGVVKSMLGPESLLGRAEEIFGHAPGRDLPPIEINVPRSPGAGEFQLSSVWWERGAGENAEVNRADGRVEEV